MAEEIEAILEKLGYSYFTIDHPIKAEEVIIKILLSKETRFVKAIPFIIYLSEINNNVVFDCNRLLKSAEQKKIVAETKAMLYATIKIFRIAHHGSSSFDKLEKVLSTTEKNLYEVIFQSDDFKQFNKKINVPVNKLNALKGKNAKVYYRFDELLYEFIGQKKLFELKKQVSLAEKLTLSKENDLQYALHTLYKPKQLEIINKVADNKKLTKIEYDYYFKTIKKRLRAVKLLAEFADNIIQKKVSKE